MLWADPGSGTVFVFGAVRRRVFAVTAAVRVRTFAFVATGKNSTIAGLILIPGVAESDGTVTGSHLARGLIGNCDWAKPNMDWLIVLFCNLLIILIDRLRSGVTLSSLEVFPEH